MVSPDGCDGIFSRVGGKFLFGSDVGSSDSPPSAVGLFYVGLLCYYCLKLELPCFFVTRRAALKLSFLLFEAALSVLRKSRICLSTMPRPPTGISLLISLLMSSWMETAGSLLPRLGLPSSWLLISAKLLTRRLLGFLDSDVLLFCFFSEETC